MASFFRQESLEDDRIKDPKIDKVLVGGDTWPVRGQYGGILRNADGKIDGTDPPLTLEGVLDHKNLELEGKPSKTWRIQHWTQCNYS